MDLYIASLVSVFCSHLMPIRLIQDIHIYISVCVCVHPFTQTS